jgi:hypothetical protein
MHRSAPRFLCPFLYGFPQNSCQNSTQISVPESTVHPPRKVCQLSRINAETSSRFLCQKNSSTTSTNPYRTAQNCPVPSPRFLCCSLVSWNPCHLQKTSSLVQLDFSLSNSLQKLSQQEKMRRLLTLIDSMREYEEFLNPTVEIGLDEWLRLNVHSLTPFT